MFNKTSPFLFLVFLYFFCNFPLSAETDEYGTHGFAMSGDVKIHYVTSGSGPLVVMIHGFPDYWYSWRHQMPELAKHFKVVAIDLPGYNKSSQPSGVENYQLQKIAADVKAVLKHFNEEQAIIVGHDWGGAVAWQFAMQYPDAVTRLVILNLPHPWAMRRELATNPTQAQNSQYARDFQQPGAHKALTAEGLANWVKDDDARRRYVTAFKRSSFEAMLNYYKANYPRPPYKLQQNDPIKVKCPVLMIHGLGDVYLLADGLNGTWNWLEKPLTLVTVPNAKHFVHHDQPEFVTETMLRWLNPVEKLSP